MYAATWGRAFVDEVREWAVDVTGPANGSLPPTEPSGLDVQERLQGLVVRRAAVQQSMEETLIGPGTAGPCAADARADVLADGRWHPSTGGGTAGAAVARLGSAALLSEAEKDYLAVVVSDALMSARAHAMEQLQEAMREAYDIVAMRFATLSAGAVLDTTATAATAFVTPMDTDGQPAAPVPDDATVATWVPALEDQVAMAEVSVSAVTEPSHEVSVLVHPPVVPATAGVAAGGSPTGKIRARVSRNSTVGLRSSPYARRLRSTSDGSVGSAAAGTAAAHVETAMVNVADTTSTAASVKRSTSATATVTAPTARRQSIVASTRRQTLAPPGLPRLPAASVTAPVPAPSASVPAAPLAVPSVPSTAIRSGRRQSMVPTPASRPPLAEVNQAAPVRRTRTAAFEDFFGCVPGLATHMRVSGRGLFGGRWADVVPDRSSCSGQAQADGECPASEHGSATERAGPCGRHGGHRIDATPVLAPAAADAARVALTDGTRATARARAACLQPPRRPCPACCPRQCVAPLCTNTPFHCRHRAPRAPASPEERRARSAAGHCGPPAAATSASGPPALNMAARHSEPRRPHTPPWRRTTGTSRR